MGSIIPWSSSVEIDSIGEDLANTVGTTVTANASANTEGAWAELTASTPCQSRSLELVIWPKTLSAICDFLVNISIGGSGSESDGVVVETLLISFGNNTDYRFHRKYSPPIGFPAGSRISANCQCSTGSSELYIMGGCEPETFNTPAMGQRVVSYGQSTGDSGGTQVDPGASANTKGAYVELIASTDHPIYAVGLSFGSQLNGAQRNQIQLFDIAVGSAGNEVPIVNNIFMQNNGFEHVLHTGQFYKTLIPEGTRVSVRSQADNTISDDRLHDVVLHCVE